jgi:hypothetical protein
LIRGLLVLNSSTYGSRDLWWPHEPRATQGYNIYRAADYPTNWVKLNPHPIPGQFFRDQSQLELIQYNVQLTDWVDQGEAGMYGFRLPFIPWAEVVKGRPVVADSPDDVSVTITYPEGSGIPTVTTRPAMVTGVDRTVWLRVDRTLATGGAVSATPILDLVDGVGYVATFSRLINFVDIFTNMRRDYYTVVPIGNKGEIHLPGAKGTEIVDSSMVDRQDYMQTEEIRRNGWLFEQVAEPAYLLYRRVAGERCECAKNIVDTPRTGCPTCFETGFVGGYYGPYDFGYVDPDQGTVRTIDEGGIKVERQSVSYLGPTPIVQDGDLIVRRNGERLVINGVNYTRPRGVLLQQQFNVQLLNPRDTRYLIPLGQLPEPVLYNPVVKEDPRDGVGGGEPLVHSPSKPHQHWENPDKQVGRTVTFNRIKG